MQDSKPITVGELRKLLENHSPDLPVYLEWEGQYIKLDTANRITEEEFLKSGEEILVINADNWGQ
jgi:hypothetical protein